MTIRPPLLVALALACATWGGLSPAHGLGPKVSHLPEQPRSGEPVRITARLADAPPDGPMILQYQLVDPGHYIDLKEEAFKTNWSRVTMTAENPANGTAKGSTAFR